MVVTFERRTGRFSRGTTERLDRRGGKFWPGEGPGGLEGIGPGRDRGIEKWSNRGDLDRASGYFGLFLPQIAAI